MARPKRVRTQEERLRLFDQHVTELVTESASMKTFTLLLDFKEWRFGGASPERESLRSYIIAVRNLASPGEADLFLPNVMKDLESYPLTPWSLAWLQVFRREYEWIDTHEDAYQAARGWLTLRDQFELLAYADHLHRNPDYEDALRSMDPFTRQMTLARGHNYALRITNLAVKLQAIGRVDPSLQPFFAARDEVPLRDTSTHGVFRVG